MLEEESRSEVMPPGTVHVVRPTPMVPTRAEKGEEGGGGEGEGKRGGDKGKPREIYR